MRGKILMKTQLKPEYEQHRKNQKQRVKDHTSAKFKMFGLSRSFHAIAYANKLPKKEIS